MIFADSSYWIALGLPRDDRHAEAARLARVVTGSIVTSDHVVGETWTFLRRRAGHAAAMAWLAAVRRGAGIRIRAIDQQVQAEAWAWLAVHDERAYSFVDATSFALMRRLRIGEALAFDGDFAAAGFVELRS